QGEVLFRQRPPPEDTVLPRFRAAPWRRTAWRCGDHRRGRFLTRHDGRILGFEIPGHPRRLVPAGLPPAPERAVMRSVSTLPLREGRTLREWEEATGTIPSKQISGRGRRRFRMFINAAFPTPKNFSPRSKFFDPPSGGGWDLARFSL